MKYLTPLKAYTALVGSVLAALVGVYGDQTWYAVAVAVVTALATYAVPNAKEVKSTDRTARTPHA